MREELEEIEEVEEVDANELDELVKEESTSPEPNEMRKLVVETISKMTLWGEVNKEFENEKMTPIIEVDEFFFQLNKGNEIANIVRNEEKTP